VLAYASNFIEIRSDGYQLLYMTKRVLPKDAEDIGTWLEIFQIIAAASVVTNSGLLCFTLRVITIDGIGLVWIFIGMQYFVFFLRPIFTNDKDLERPQPLGWYRQGGYIRRVFGGFLDFLKNEHDKPIGTPYQGL